MIVLGIIGFFVALAGSMLLAAASGAVAARICRAFWLWAPLTLILSLVTQVSYLSAIGLVKSFWHVEAGDDPYWTRYLHAVADNWEFGVQFGVVMGIVGWVWCLKRYWHFTSESSPAVTKPNSPEVNDGLREAIAAAIQRRRDEEARGKE